MSRVATQATTQNSSVIVQFDTINYDPNGNCTTGSAAKITAPINGLYLMSYIGSIGNNAASNYVDFDLWKNGSYYISLYRNSSQNLTNGLFCNGAFEFELNAGDYIQLFVQQNVAANLSCAGTQMTLSFRAFI